MRKIAAVLMVMALLLLNLSPMTVLAKPNGPERVEATDIELVKKVTLKGGGS